MGLQRGLVDAAAAFRFRYSVCIPVEYSWCLGVATEGVPLWDISVAELMSGFWLLRWAEREGTVGAPCVGVGWRWWGWGETLPGEIGRCRYHGESDSWLNVGVVIFEISLDLVVNVVLINGVLRRSGHLVFFSVFLMIFRGNR